MQALPRFSRAALAAAALCAATLSSPLALAAPPADQRADASSAPANSADTATWRALSRLGYGPTPALVAQVRQAGGARAWALAQVDAAFAASRLPPAPAPELAPFDQPLPQIFASVKAEREELPALLGDPRCRPAPYLARGGWIVMDLERPVDWAEVRELIHTSYRLIAPKTLAKQVD